MNSNGCARRPPGWQCRREWRFLSRDVGRLLGFSPKVDISLEKIDGTRRLLVELEVSRADPVANHVKFATANLFQAIGKESSFVSMVSNHVAAGRRNLSAHTILVMRKLGIRAHQLMLLPELDGEAVKRLNHMDPTSIAREKLSIGKEIDRLFTIADPLLVQSGWAIHFAGNEMEVRLNLCRWNQEMATEVGKRNWGRRTITYFVFDPVLRLFAPSKFCAYTVLPNGAEEEGGQACSQTLNGGMSLAVYK